MDFSFSSIMAGFTFGVFGFYLIKEGKRKSNIWQMLVGIILLVYPYFTADPVLTWVIGVLLLAFAYLKR